MPADGWSAAHLPTLDGLRGVAIIAVLVHNLVAFSASSDLFSRSIEIVLNRGWIGVQLFFVLSGFLITGILLDTRQNPHYFRRFFVRRALRIFPLYYVALVLLVIVLPRIGPHVAACEPNGSLLPYWLFYSNWTQPFIHENECIDQFWSLAVEEQFYLVWPLLIWFCPPRRALILCLAVAFASPICRAALLALGGSTQMVYQFTICRMDALALGAAAASAWRIPGWREAIVRHQGRLMWLALWIGLAGLVITRGYPRMSPSGQIVGYFMSSLCLSVLTLAAASSDQGGRQGVTARLLRRPVLRFMGRYSYGLYVLHKPVSFLLCHPLLTAIGWASFPAPDSLIATSAYALICTLLTIVLAMISYHGLEKPFLALKSRLSGEASGASRTAPNAAG